MSLSRGLPSIDFRPISALLQQLPDGKWTQAQRDRWIAALTATIDYLVEVEEIGEGDE